MKNVLIATDKPFAPVAIHKMGKIIRKAGYNLALLEKYTSKQELLEAIKNADAVIIRSDIIEAEVFNVAPNLKIVVRAGAGTDNVDLKAATEKGVVVMNTPGQNSNAVAELAAGFMIFMARGQFQGISGSELKGKRLGIHAYGYVGKGVAAIAKGFGMKVLAFDPFIPAAAIEHDGVTAVNSVEELYAQSEYLSLHIPANEKTKASVNYALLASMPKGATLVNTARKEVICEDSLKKIFADREDFKYASDIAPACHAELAEKYAQRYFSTPKKQGAETSEANINAGLAAAKQIVGFIKNGDRTFQVNK
jgi:D-3-phosphoglycerate dehydrogenase